MVLIESRTLVFEQVPSVQVGTRDRDAPVFQDGITASDPIFQYPVQVLSLQLCHDIAQDARPS